MSSLAKGMINHSQKGEGWFGSCDIFLHARGLRKI